MLAGARARRSELGSERSVVMGRVGAGASVVDCVIGAAGVVEPGEARRGRGAGRTPTPAEQRGILSVVVDAAARCWSSVVRASSARTSSTGCSPRADAVDVVDDLSTGSPRQPRRPREPPAVSSRSTTSTLRPRTARRWSGCVARTWSSTSGWSPPGRADAETLAAFRAEHVERARVGSTRRNVEGGRRPAGRRPLRRGARLASCR